ncbi:hypothetical protein E6O75_ATG06374 [Venturia nashicola]|uniref:Uncharacterized protein n=1 Tax=Venturia nashicola TaxID=86259 RepID=A0A4Z1PBE0_9PEZI|nr:hypothetical protein E6O75_ATG06374 [Venturia nashicola]
MFNITITRRGNLEAPRPPSRQKSFHINHGAQKSEIEIASCAPSWDESDSTVNRLQLAVTGRKHKVQDTITITIIEGQGNTRRDLDYVHEKWRRKPFFDSGSDLAHNF